MLGHHSLALSCVRCVEESLERSRCSLRVLAVGGCWPGYSSHCCLLLLIVCLRAIPAALPWSLREVMLGQVTSDQCQKDGQ